MDAKLKQKYISLNNNSDFFTHYSEMGRNKGGRIFQFQNTNYRCILSFLKNYSTFKEADGVERSKWEVNNTNQQEKLKQHTINMIKSRLFSKNESTYYHTKKGAVLEKINSNDDFTSDDKWILIYLLILDSYFADEPNYILKQAQRTIEGFVSYKQNYDAVEEMLRMFIVDPPRDNSQLFMKEYLYYDTFNQPMNGIDFLSKYSSASKSERDELARYITDNYLASRWSTDCVCKKYKPNGNYNRSMIRDNALLLYMSYFILKSNFSSFAEYAHKTIQHYKEIIPINTSEIFNFVFDSDNKDVFELSYINIFNENYFDSDDSDNAIEVDVDQEQNINNEKTVVEDIKKLKRISTVIKKRALELAQYKCELEDLHDCTSHYFTSKKTNRNYMEIHHLIPREFSNDFETSIERVENYVSLCPRCHRLLHNANDRERQASLNHLYNKRIGDLNLHGIKIEKSTLNKYYGIDNGA